MPSWVVKARRAPSRCCRGARVLWSEDYVLSGWSVETRRAPSRHCRHARIYRLKTTVMRGSEPPNGKSVMSAQVREESLLGVGTVFRLERDAWLMV